MSLPISLLTLLLVQTNGPNETLAEAQAAYGVYDVNRAEALYRQVAGDAGASRKDRAVAARELARIAWLVDGRGEVALDGLARSLPNDPDPCPAAHLYARVHNDTSPTPAPYPLVADFATSCMEIEPGVALEAVRTLQLQALALHGPAQRSAAAAGLAHLNDLPEGVRYSAQGATLQLSLGILASDAAAALEGWRRYFWLEDGEDAPQAIDVDVERVFRAGLAPRPSTGEALRFARLLMRTGFHEDLRQYAQRHDLSGTAGEAWRPVAAYLDLREALARETLAHDRRYARSGAADEDAYERRLKDLLVEAARQAGATSDDPIEASREAFGLWGAIGKTNGVSSIHLGHVVIDERLEVAQDGRTGDVRMISLDNMVHNSFSAWLMDGASAPGGWAVDGAVIVQVRPRYLQLIDEYARLGRPGPARDRELARTEALRISDRAIAASTPIAHLPGVRARLRLGAIDDLAASVRADLSAGESFEIAFRRAYMNALVTSAITAHEGRHVLDQASFKDECALENAELEYRAKLSEIRFASNSRLAMSSIFSPLFGGDSGHGVANKRLAGDFAGWISANPDHVAGYDSSLSPLEQLDRLTDEQFRMIAAALERPAAPGCG